MKKNLLFIVLIIVAASCGSSNKSQTSSSQFNAYETIATEKLGEDVNYFKNESGSYVLCTHEVAGTVQKPRNNLYYLVIKIADNKIVLENRINGGTVSWFDDDEIEVYLTPGMVRKDQTTDDFKTLHNVITGKNRQKLNSELH